MEIKSMTRTFGTPGIFLLTALALGSAAQALNRASAQQQRPPALLQDYIKFSVTSPPAALSSIPSQELRRCTRHSGRDLRQGAGCRVAHGETSFSSCWRIARISAPS
jgi:hypothetical protein